MSSQTAELPKNHELSLRQKLIEMRKACQTLNRKSHYNDTHFSVKICDIWKKITPVMNRMSVEFDIIKEEATRYAESGDPAYWITIQTKSINGDKLMFLYESDLTIRWTNLNNEEDVIETIIHAIGWEDNPAKAKWMAHMQALKCYLCEKFAIYQPESELVNDTFATNKKRNIQTNEKESRKESVTRLSNAQLNRLYKKAKAAGISKDRIDLRIAGKYEKSDPATLNRQEYDDICNSLDIAAAKLNQTTDNHNS